MADYWDFSDVDITPYIHNESGIQELMEGINPQRKKTKEREYCTRTVIALSERHPESLFARWDEFVKCFDTDNASSKMASLYVIANLAIGDKTDRFEQTLPAYIKLLNDPSVGVCSHAAMNLGKIAKANAGLREKITGYLLAIQEINKNPERVDMISGYTIKAFDVYFDESEQKDSIVGFVFGLLESKSPSTQKVARAFLKDHGIK